MKKALRVGAVVLVVAGILLFLFGGPLSAAAVDWLWFGELGQRGVWSGLLAARLGLGFGFGALMFALAYVNLRLARRGQAPAAAPRAGRREWQQVAERVARQGVALGLTGGALALGVISGLVAATRWDDWLRFTHPQPFGTIDPVFHTDLGFYVFRYPFLRFTSGWLFLALLAAAAGSALVYYLDGALVFLRQRVRVSGPVHVHVSILLGLGMLALAWIFWLERFGLLLQAGGLVHGAGYTDLHARLPALNILMGVAILAALGFFLNASVRALWLPALALAFMVVAGITVGMIYPAMTQRFVVAPDEQARERPYIQHHLEATRRAYGLDGLETAEYHAGKPLSAADLGAQRGTLENVRLWDYRVLGQTYQRLQGLRNYYQVGDVDVDRYVLDGRLRQVMLAPRELVSEQLDPQNRRWVNERLQYTHGYGLVMSAVNEADPSGRPSWLVSNLPLETSGGPKIDRPQLYYGMADLPPVVAPSGSKELDYPLENESVTSQYAGSGGIPLRGLSRLLFSAHLKDGNLLISDQVRPESRILVRRQVQERIARLAPFLSLDPDPYLVVLDGKLVWVQDAYTTASTYPYSEATALEETRLRSWADGAVREGYGGEINYLRGSVKAVVDGYSGAVTLYAMDAADPVLRAYERAFPGLFHPVAEMAPELQAHLRYPEELFSIQSHKMLRFHVSNPDVFFNRSDVWEIPTERLQEGGGQETATLEPYYVVMRLPGRKEEEFVLILPFRTRAGTTMAAWLSGGCDGDEYGKLRLFRFPTTSQVDAPEQVDQAIITNRKVSSETTLLGQVGTSVRYGNLLVLPVGESLLYVKPLYLEGRQQDGRGGIPELKYVILAEKRGRDLKVVMEPTLREALAALVGGAPPADLPPPGPKVRDTTPAPGAASDLPSLAREAQSAFEAGERALKAGNWAEYGRQMERVRAALRRMGAGR